MIIILNLRWQNEARIKVFYAKKDEGDCLSQTDEVFEDEITVNSYNCQSIAL